MHTHHRKHATPARAGATGPATTTTSVARGGEGREARSVSADDIRLCAYRKWEGAGKPPGDGTRFWLEAEQELTRGGECR